MLETLYNHLSDTPGELRQPWIFETTTQLAKLLVVNKWDIFIFCITTSFPWFKSFKWFFFLSLLFCRGFDTDFLMGFLIKNNQQTAEAVHLTSPFHAAVPVQQIAPHRWWRSPLCFHQGLGWWVFPPAFPPKICAACQIWIPWFHSIFPRYHFRWWRFSNKNRWKKLPTHRCLQFFRKLPASQVTKCHRTYISWVTRMWPEILVCLPQRTGRFWPIFSCKNGSNLMESYGKSRF